MIFSLLTFILNNILSIKRRFAKQNSRKWLNLILRMSLEPSLLESGNSARSGWTRDRAGIRSGSCKTRHYQSTSQIRSLHLERSSNSVLACHFFFGIEGSASWEGLSAAPDVPAKLIFISANFMLDRKSILFFQFSRKSRISKNPRYSLL